MQPTLYIAISYTTAEHDDDAVISLSDQLFNEFLSNSMYKHLSAGEDSVTFSHSIKKFPLPLNGSVKSGL